MRYDTRILTSEGKIIMVATDCVELVHREVVAINGEKVEIYIKNTGRGKDTNTILVNHGCEIGNLTPDRVQELLNTFLHEKAIDLSDVRTIHKENEIVEGEEYLYLDTCAWRKRIVDMQD